MDFIDIIDFTKKASTLDPAFLIQKLNEIYAAFDKIIDNCTCERIKTIGDSYMFPACQNLILNMPKTFSEVALR